MRHGSLAPRKSFDILALYKSDYYYYYYAPTKAQSKSLEAVQKRAIHILHNPTRGMPYASMLFYSKLNSLASRREKMFWKRIPVFIVSFLHLDHQLSPQGSDLLKSSLTLHFAWWESGGGSRNGAELDRAKSAETGFSASLEEGAAVEGRKIPKYDKF